MKAIPEMPGGLSPELLTELLHDDGILPAQGRVAKVTREQVGDGTGMMTELARLVVTYEGDAGEAPASFVAKFASRNPTNREVALTYNLHERETRFANELDPLTTARTPRTYFSGMDEDRFLILMEDMSDYQVGDQVLGADLRQSELAIDELAKLHSAFWGKVGGLDWVPGIAHSYHAENMQALSVIGMEGIAQKFSEFLADEIKHQSQRYLDAIPVLQSWMMTEPLTLVHGDFRMANLLYGCKPGHDPVAVLDWQGPLIARGMNDVALFLGQSTTTDVRRRHERDLLERYLDGLRDGGVQAPGMDEAWEEYRRTVLYNWVYVVVVAGTLDVSNQTAYEWMSQMVARQTATSHDLKVFELMP